ncbi:GroES-like protein [Favolaschia claudopus]|uniref:GroES-like protein n=1 Tax=Favolaschia claudopus TaxID=2862362 RepID=A0AAW0D5X8_9AGAR
MSSTTQQALIIPTPKAPFVVGSLPVPVPLSGEVRVKVICATDISGVVDELGEGVQGFEKGDEILVQVIYGGCQQYTVVPAATLIRKPKNINFDEAATFPITFTTACVGLLAPEPIGLGLNPSFSWDKPQNGQSALVIGGGSSVGQFAIQLLKFLGFTRIVVYASNTHFDYLKTLGATEFIDRKEVPVENIAHAVKPAVQVVYDSTGALNAAIDSVVDGGKVATSIPTAKPTRDFETRGITFNTHTGLYAGPDVMKPVGDPALYLGRLEHTEFGRILIREVPMLVEQRVVVGNRVEIVPNGLAGIPDALDRIAVGAVRGVKLVAHPQDSV